MTLQEIKKAIDSGRCVYWKNTGYHVIKNKLGGYLIKFIHNGNCIGLTWRDGITLNGEENDFFMRTVK